MSESLEEILTEWRAWLDADFVDQEGPRLRSAFESALASERAKLVEAEREREVYKVQRNASEQSFYRLNNRTLAAEATIEQVREWSDHLWDYKWLRESLEAILANAGTSALARHDAEVAARALEEAADDYGTGIYEALSAEAWLRARAAEKRAANTTEGGTDE